jgi:hypothetical protein
MRRIELLKYILQAAANLTAPLLRIGPRRRRRGMRIKKRQPF